MPRAEGAHVGDGAWSSWATEPVKDVGAFMVGARRVPSPPASPPAMGLSTRVEQASSVLVPPMGMSLGALSRPHQEDVPGCSGEAAEGIEEIARVPLHPWDAPAYVTWTFMKRGD